MSAKSATRTIKVNLVRLRANPGGEEIGGPDVLNETKERVLDDKLGCRYLASISNSCIHLSRLGANVTEAGDRGMFEPLGKMVNKRLSHRTVKFASWTRYAQGHGGFVILTTCRQVALFVIEVILFAQGC